MILQCIKILRRQRRQDNWGLTLKALQPLLVLATRQPSVVAMGTMYCRPSSSRGPATPTGTGMYPTTFSQHAPDTWQVNKQAQCAMPR